MYLSKHQKKMFGNFNFLFVLSYFALLQTCFCGIVIDEDLRRFLRTLEPYEQTSNDVVFVLDESGSIGAENFPQVKLFTELTCRQLSVAPTQSRVSIITFATYPRTHVDQIKKSEGNNMCTLLKDINDIDYVGDWTHTSVAMAEARKLLAHARKDSNKIIILVTDGRSNDGYDPTAISTELRNKGVIIFAIGVADVNEKELDAVATSKDHIYILKDFQYIYTVNNFLKLETSEVSWDNVTDTSLCNNFCESGHDCCDTFANCYCGTKGGNYECTCKPGYFGSGHKGKCYQCSRGTYKSKAGVQQCSACPQFSTTKYEGSISVSDCTCISGYEGNPSAGTPCKTVRCVELKNPTGGLIIPPNCSNSYGTECFFKCNEGYCPFHCDSTRLSKVDTLPWHFQSTEPRKCLETGRWSGVDFYCDTVRCPALDYLENGKYNCSEFDVLFSFNTVCQFTCNKGHNLIGSEYRTCSLNGTWSGTNTFCKAVECERLKTNAYLLVKPMKCGSQKMTYSSVCQYYCKMGFKLTTLHEHKNSSGIRECLENGEWSGINESLYCEDVSPPQISCSYNKAVVRTDPHKAIALYEWKIPKAQDNVAVKSVNIIEPSNIYKPPYAFPIGQTKVVYEAVDTSGLKNTCSFTVTVVDVEQPQKRYCPTDIEIQHGKRTGIPITWKEPQFSDNSGQALQITRSHVNGQNFTWGTYQIFYNASDPAGNSVTCRFAVKVKAYSCYYAHPPANGGLACDTWSNGQFCSVFCNEGYEFVKEPEPVYFCKQATRKWSRLPGDRTKGILQFPWPDCASIQVTKALNVSVSVKFFTPGCDEETVQKMKEKFISVLKAKEKDIPKLCSAIPQCDPRNVNITCRDTSSDIRVKRDISSFTDSHLEKQPNFHFVRLQRSTKNHELVVTFNIELTPEILKEVVSKEADACENCTQNVIDLNEKIYEVGQSFANNLTLNVSEVVRSAYDDNSIDVEKFSYNILPVCQIGEIMKNKSCVKCPVGTYYNNSVKDCITCPVGFYQDEEGALECKNCPFKKSTSSSGSKSLFDCIGPCAPGTFSDRGIEPCITCPQNFYQDQWSSTSCLDCPGELKTWFVGANSSKDCVDVCHPGSYSANGYQPCLLCPVGTYQEFPQKTDCDECPVGTTTRDSGALSNSSCETFNNCENHPCAEGATCVSSNNSYDCICPDGLEGVHCEINVDDCKNVDCNNNGLCIDGLNDFTCICNSGFSGASCEHNIDDCRLYSCRNHGTCIDQVNGYTCQCQEGFAGESCEINIDDCKSDPCLNGGTCFDMENDFECCCPVGFTGHTCDIKIDPCNDVTCFNGGTCASNQEVSCFCEAGYTGKFCEINIDDCRSNNPCENGGICIDGVNNISCSCSDLFDGEYCENTLPSKFSLVFPSQVTSNYVVLENKKPLFAVTVSFFMKANLTHSNNRGTPVSYSYYNLQNNTVVDNALTLFDVNKIILYLHGETFYTEYTANRDFNWHHYAVTWDNSAGDWLFYVDGKLIVSGSRVAVKNYLWPGTFILGQEQDSIGGSFSITEAFVGEITGFNVWDFAMDSQEIKKISACGYIGNVISWSAAYKYMQGDLKVIHESTLCKSSNMCPTDDCFCVNYKKSSGESCEHTFKSCSENLCVNNQKCQQLGDKAFCECSSGYAGKYCEHDVDECLLNNGNCSHKCMNTIGAYHCTCPDGWKLKEDKQSCKETSYCTTGKHNYLDGEIWRSFCDECTCILGDIFCKVVTCPNVTCSEDEILILLPGHCCETCVKQSNSCALFGNYTMKTFNSLQLELQHVCQYTLIQDKINGEFALYFDTFNNSMILQIDCNEIKIFEETLTVNNNETVLPFEDKSVHISNESSGLQIWTRMGFLIEWANSNDLYIQAPYFYEEELSGVCGNFRDCYDEKHHQKQLSSKSIENDKMWKSSCQECSCIQSSASITNISFPNTTCLKDTEIWKSPCQECACIHGSIFCKNMSCPDISCLEDESLVVLPGQCCEMCIKQSNSCSLLGYSTLKTFNSVEFNLRRNCHYTLLKDNGTFLFYFESSNNSIILHVASHEIKISEGNLSLNNKEIFLPFKDETILISNKSSELQIWTNIGFLIEWSYSNDFHIQVPYSYEGKIVGLCENFNNQYDKKQPSSEVTELSQIPNLEAYVKCSHNILYDKINAMLESSYQIKSKMTKYSVPWIGTCFKARKKHRNKALKACRVFRRKSFRPCWKHVDFESFYYMCIRDACACKFDVSCFCDSVFTYIAECWKQNVYVFDLKTVEICARRCPSGMIYDDCGSSCPTTCFSNETAIHQCSNTKCIPGCYCPSGKVLFNNKCINKDECPIVP